MEENFQTQNQMPKRNLPRDVFLHLFAIVALYWSAISFITLCWQYINYFFPDVLNSSYRFSSTMKFAMASLFIVFPLFILVSWILAKIYSKESEVREGKIRKWLIYLTLFITALVIIGDLVFVINTFLNGEITARFILKALSIILITGSIFWYYLDDVRRNSPSKMGKYFAWVLGILVLVGIVGAFFIVGSPLSARKVQFDQQRISDLQNIQYQVVNYWQRKDQMPQSLANLNDSISGYVAPNDPENGAPYEYNLKDATTLSFELCTTFDLSSNGSSMKTAPPPVYPYDYSQNWDHAAGHVCFPKLIDKQLYPPSTRGK